MNTGRLEAFSDGVLAIIITIMVLDLKVPHEATLAALGPVLPVLFSYALSFVYVGIYWNNHHHMFHATAHLGGLTLWANLHLLFWLSLIPFVTSWLGGTHFAARPAAIYGVVLLMCAIAYWILQQSILRAPGGNPVLASALGNNLKGKISPAFYLVAIPISFVSRWMACGLYVLVAVMWLIPDRRIEERVIDEIEKESAAGN
jgi:uncharacterized membrane protein